VVGSCTCVSGLPPTAPAQGKQPLILDQNEGQGAGAWKPSEQHAGIELPRGKTKQPSRLRLQALLRWSRVRLQDGRAPALLRGPIWQSSWREATLPWANPAQTCLAARLPTQEGAAFAKLGDATGAFLASAPLLHCLCT